MAAVDELRARVGTLISAAAIATGFLAGQALDTTHGVPAGAWLWMAAAFAVILSCAYILLPRKWAGLSINTTIMLEDIDNLPSETISQFQRRMTVYARTHLEANKARLRKLYWAFSSALALLCIDFAGWIWVLANH
jgi:hypothetical protein